MLKQTKIPKKELALLFIHLASLLGCGQISPTNSADASVEPKELSVAIQDSSTTEFADAGENSWSRFGPGDAEIDDRSLELGKLGDPCQENADCQGQWCVPSDIGYICTQACIDDCPQGWQCKGAAGTEPDVIFVCLPDMETVCNRVGVCQPGQQQEEQCGNCGTRTRVCQDNCKWSPWSDCFGEGVCKQGTYQEEKCGKCGTKSRQCNDQCTWTPWTECQNQGECYPGDMETQPCGNCGDKTRSCNEACKWGEWSACLGEGECAPGQTDEQACGNCGKKVRVCNPQCQWDQWGECTNQGPCSPQEQQSQPCGKCGTQIRTCTTDCQWTQWGACQNQGVCTPGEKQAQQCGNCGTQERNCQSDCTWGEWGICIDTGVCSPGEIDTMACGNCGIMQRQCTNNCVWAAWGVCQGQGPCKPGQKEYTDCGWCGTKSRTCNAQCQWEPWGQCTGQGFCQPGSTTPCNNCGIKTCTDSCVWGTCVIGTVDGYEENDSWWHAYELPGITDAAGDTQTVKANINPAYDQDWYEIHIQDTAFHSIDPKVTLTGVPSGQTYKLCVTYYCDKSSKSVNGCTTVSSSGSVSLDVGGCQSWFDGDNDSGTAVIQIEPLTSGSCNNYTLKIEA